MRYTKQAEKIVKFDTFEIGRRITAARRLLHMSQENLSSLAGIGRNTLINLENGVHVGLSSLFCVIETLREIRRMSPIEDTDWSFDYFLTGRKTMPEVTNIKIGRAEFLSLLAYWSTATGIIGDFRWSRKDLSTIAISIPAGAEEFMASLEKGYSDLDLATTVLDNNGFSNLSEAPDGEALSHTNEFFGQYVELCVNQGISPWRLRNSKLWFNQKDTTPEKVALGLNITDKSKIQTAALLRTKQIVLKDITMDENCEITKRTRVFKRRGAHH